MLEIIVPKQELYNEVDNEFIYLDEEVLLLEHSLVSLSKWESKYCKPFLGPGEKTDEEILYYIESMIVKGNSSTGVVKRISLHDMNLINEYLSSPQSATTFSDTGVNRPGIRPEVITSELIYFWMTSYNVPFECETWHLNRLFALLRICNIKNSKEKKMSRHEIAARNRELNAQRRAQHGSRG